LTPNQPGLGATVVMEVKGSETTGEEVQIAFDQVLTSAVRDEEYSCFETVIPEDAGEGLRLVTLRVDIAAPAAIRAM
jgi:hypothetical protein